MFVQWQWQCISQRGLMLHLQSNYRVVVVVVIVVVVFGYAPDQTRLYDRLYCRCSVPV